MAGASRQYPVRGRRGCVPLCLLVLSLLLLTTAVPQAVTADTHDAIVGAKVISGDPSSSIGIGGVQGFSDVAFDDFGRVHVVWQDKRSGVYNILYARSDDGGRSYGPNVRVVSASPALTYINPAVAVDSWGNPHVAWEDPRNAATRGLDVYYARSYDGGDTFGPNVRVNSDDLLTRQSTPSVAVASNGVVHICYVSGEAEMADIYLSTSSDGGRSFAPMVKVNDDAGSKKQKEPDVTADAAGIVHMVWTDERLSDEDIYYASRNTQGVVSSNVKVNDDTPGHMQSDPSIVVAGAYPLVVWEDERDGDPDVYSARRLQPTSFSTNSKVNDDSNSDRQLTPVAATSASDTVHVAWQGVRSGKSNVFIANSTDGGQSFGPDVMVNVDLVADAPQNSPCIAGWHEGGVVVAYDDKGRPTRQEDVVATRLVEGEATVHAVVSDDGNRALECEPATDVGPDGRLHAVWVDNRRGVHEVYYASSPDGGANWGSISRVASQSSPTQQLDPDVAVGPDGTVHVTWTDYRASQPQAFYANTKDRSSGFNAERRLDDSPGSGFAVGPSLAVADNGTLVATWLDGRDGQARLRAAYSLDTGETWVGPSLQVPGPEATSDQRPAELCLGDGLVALAYTDDADGMVRSYLVTGEAVTDLGAPVALEANPASIPRDLQLTIASGSEEAVHLVWTDARDGGDDVRHIAYDPTEGTLSEVTSPLTGTSTGPRAMASIAAGDGGALHMAWVDLGPGGPTAWLMTTVPGLDDPIHRSLPSTSDSPSSHPAVGFAAHQLSVVYVQDLDTDPDVVGAHWSNDPPPVPLLQSPPSGGWVIEATFNITVQPGVDGDGDPVLVRFEVQTPGGGMLERPFSASPRFQLTEAQEGTYVWRAYSTDGYGIHMSGWYNFTVDLTEPSQPAFEGEPDFTPGRNNTLYWSEATDPGGGGVLYRVVASQSSSFTPPLLDDSGWIFDLNHTFSDLPETTIHYKLQAKDAAGNLVEAPETVSSTQDDQAPKPFIKVDPPLTAEEGEVVSFDATGSTDNNGIAEYHWDFDSDGTYDSEDANATYSYDEPGEYTITIRLVDVAGNELVFSDYTLDILDISPPVIAYTLDPGLSFDEDTVVTFDGSGTDDPSGLSSIRWYLGDSELPFSSEAVATYKFAEPGDFVVKLEAVDMWDNLASESFTVTVADVTPPEVTFPQIGQIDNTEVEFFTLYVNVTDNGELTEVTLYYKTQETPTFLPLDMAKVPGTFTEWSKDELSPGGKGNATYYVIAKDAAGNENKTDYQKIRVVGVEDPSPNGNGGGTDGGFDLMENWWLILLVVVIVAAAGGAAAASRRRGGPKADSAAAAPAAPAAPATPPTLVPAAAPTTAEEKALCAIEEVYFIHNDGRLIHAASSSKETAGADEQDVFAGMFTAIQDFMKDSLAREGSLGSFEYGDNRIIIERGKSITCAVTIYGTQPKDLRDEVREVVRQVEGNYAGVIERWDGDKGKLGGISEFGTRILGLAGGVDRETVMRSREKKGVKLLSEVEFFQGFVRLKAAVKNDTDAVVTDAALDMVYDDNVLRLDHIQPVYEYKRGKVYLGNVNAGEKKTVAFNFDPIICMESMLDGNLTYRDVSGKLQVVSMKSRRADIVCPIFFTKENANTAMLKRLVREELAAKDSKVFRYPDGLAPSQAFELCKGVVHLHDVKFVREFVEEKPAWIGEAWFYGETKVKGFKIVIRVTVREDTHTSEFYVASSQMEVITGLLAELGHSLNRMLKEKYMGRLKAKPIVDQRLKKDLTEQPLLLEREMEE